MEQEVLKGALNEQPGGIREPGAVCAKYLGVKSDPMSHFLNLQAASWCGEVLQPQKQGSIWESHS